MDAQDKLVRGFQNNAKVDKGSKYCEFIGTGIVKGPDGNDQLSAFFGVPNESLDKNGKLVSYDTFLAKSAILSIKENGSNPPYFEPALLAIRQREIMLKQPNQGMRPNM